MLRALVPEASRLLSPEPGAMAQVRAALVGEWRVEAIELLRGGWREQIAAAAALALGGGGDAPPVEALWRAIDGASWVAPQLVATAFVVDGSFAARAAERLCGVARLPPKSIGALVRAYIAGRARLPVVAELGVMTGPWPPRRRASACVASTAGSTTCRARAPADRGTRA